METDITLMVLQTDAVTDMRHVVETIERDRKFRERYEASRRAINTKQNNYRYKKQNQ